MKPSLARWVKNPELEDKVRLIEHKFSEDPHSVTSVREELQQIARQHAVDLALKNLQNALWGADYHVK